MSNDEPQTEPEQKPEAQATGLSDTNDEFDTNCRVDSAHADTEDAAQSQTTHAVAENSPPAKGEYPAKRGEGVDVEDLEPNDQPEQKPGAQAPGLNADPAVDADADEDDTDDEPEDIEEPVEIEATLETVIEAVLFASDEPLNPKRLVEIAEAGSVKDVKAAIKSLNKKYKAANHSFRIEKISGGFQMMTLSAYNPWITKLIKVRSDNKLSPAALETLAIVSYKQPIIRADIEAIRGVASGEVLRSLMFKGLVKIVGRAEILGRPMLYGTTKKFLEVFGLASLKDLPKIEELKNPEKG
jgi:segregation and condensation protein B